MNNQIVLLLSIVSSMMIMALGIPILRRLAYQWRLYDAPTEGRKIHKRFVSNLGGVAMYAALMIGFSASGYAQLIDGYPYLIIALTLLFFTGLKDDLSVLSPYSKLLIQLLASATVIFGTGFEIDHFFGFLGVEDVPSFLSVPLTMFTLIVVMNAYNLIDGIDGLAGGFGLIASTFFGVGFWVAGEVAFAVLSVFIAMVMIVFLYYNTEPAKIFMGDSGSLTIGFLLGIQAVHFTGLSAFPAFNSVFGQTSPIYAAVFLVLPLYDTLRVYIRRVSKGRSPFLPDNDHVHHIFINLGFSHRKTSLILYASTLMTILTTVALYRLDIHVIFGMMFLMIFLFMPTFGVKRRFLVRLGAPLQHWLYQPSKHQDSTSTMAKDFDPSSNMEQSSGQTAVESAPTMGQ